MIYVSANEATGPQNSLSPWACLALAVSPDLDFVPGLFLGQPALYHQGISHSFSFAVSAGFIMALFLQRKREGIFYAWTMYALAYASPLIMDLFGPDRREPYGIPLFWPLSDQTFLAPFQLFLGGHHVSMTHAGASEWVSSIMDFYNL